LERDYLVALDIGTSKTVTLVAELHENGPIEVIGVGEVKSSGLKKGIIINIDETVKAVEKAVIEAEKVANVEITKAIIGISGSHITSMNNKAVVAVASPDKEITEEDVSRVIDAAKTISIAPDKRIIHILSREFIVDNQEGIQDPKGMTGTKLEAKVHIVLGNNMIIQNLIKSVERAGIEVLDVVLNPLASAFSTLTDDEKEQGVVIVDIGGGTTEIAIFEKGSISFSSILPVGGDHVTNDLAIGLKISTSEAERIKLSHGCCIMDLVESNEKIEVNFGDGEVKQVSEREIAEIVEPRMDEIFRLVQAEIEKYQTEPVLPGGIILTGGACRIKGCVTLAKSIFDMPCRLAFPKSLIGLKDKIAYPEFSTAAGLLIYGQINNILSSGYAGFDMLTRVRDLLLKLKSLLLRKK